MKLVRFDEAALDELFDAVAWYNSQQPGLARRFLDEIDAVLPRISDNPGSCSLLPDRPPDLELRRVLLDRFPYALVFVELEREIRIVAVAHTKRRPGYWFDRLGE